MPDPAPAAPPAPAAADEQALLARLRAGDERAFGALVDGLHCRLVALARTFTPSEAVAEEAVQETWLAVIRGLRGFEGRSSLRTWIYAILVRRARTLGRRERREAAGPLPADETLPAGLSPAGDWERPPAPWGLEDPAAAAAGRETFEVVERALAAMPRSQRRVVLLRDIEGRPAAEVCNILALSETHQRVLLHRGRARIRAALDRVLGAGGEPGRNGGSA